VKPDTFKKDAWYVLIGTKVLDDGTIVHVGQCQGKDVLLTLAEHFTAHPSSHPVQVCERLGTYQQVVSVEKIS